MLLTYAGIVAVFPLMLMLIMRSFTLRFDSIDCVYEIASGVFAGLGFPFFYLALSTGVSRMPFNPPPARPSPDAEASRWHRYRPRS